VDLCCSDVSTAGVYCHGVCGEDRCHTKACESNQGQAWTCLDNADDCLCAQDPSAVAYSGVPASSCGGAQCIYSFVKDTCFCNKLGPGSVLPYEKVVPDCSARPSCACDHECN
jgi:hypothetical protein